MGIWPGENAKRVRQKCETGLAESVPAGFGTAAGLGLRGFGLRNEALNLFWVRCV
jgi:hypothetical protein